MTDPRPIPDWGTAAPLAGGYIAAECVASDGEAWPWLVAPLCPGCEDDATHGNRDTVPAHERTGRLPVQVRDALGLIHRCGRPTKRGKGPPCRIVVSEPGQVCGAHLHQVGGAP
jgi:hypothetical protein